MALPMLSRREFCETAARFGLMLGGAGAFLAGTRWPHAPVNDRVLGIPHLFGPDNALAADPLDDLIRSAVKARYWTSTALPDAQCSTCHEPGTLEPGVSPDHQGTIVKCLLCARGCVLREGERGQCRDRVNVGGELRSLVYGRPVAVHVDPIEKKPFFHFLPGSQAFSLATAGCPLRCKFCQNWEISQSKPEDHDVPFVKPSAIVDAADSRQAPVIAFTYNEPTVFTEYLTDIARQARPRGFRCVLVSCGFMNEAPLAEMCEVLDAIKIDLKGFSEDFYNKVCGAHLAPVLRSIKQVAQSGVHLEIVNLVVPTLNDSEEMLQGLSRWVVGELGPDVPVHFTRFHPDYQLVNLPPTPIATLTRAREMALAAGMHYPFVGNVPGHPGNNTYCPKCGKVVIKRQGFLILENHVKGGCCEYCGERLAGVWS
jgi:pyruvate formate lyase activating enzyme